MKSIIFKIKSSIAVYFLLAFTVATVLPLDQAKYIFSENGPYEILSVFFWIALFVLILISKKYYDFKSWISFLVISLFAASREADLQKEFSTDGFIKFNYYTNPEILIGEKILFGFILFLILLVILNATYLGLAYVFKNKLNTERSVITIQLFFLLIITKVFDRLNNTLKNDFDFHLSDSIAIVVHAFEESGEMLIPILCVTLVLLKIQEVRHRKIV